MAPAPLQHPPAKKALSPSAWQKELQQTVAVAVLDKQGSNPYSDPANDEEVDEDEDDNEEEEEIMGAAVALNDDVGMPVDYYFHGWIGFKLFGPFARDEFKSILLLTKDVCL